MTNLMGQSTVSGTVQDEAGGFLEGVRIRVEGTTQGAISDTEGKFQVNVEDPALARLICTYRGPGTQYGIAVNGAQPESIATVPTG